ncbi:MAG: hypothetical protein M3Z35_16260 [Nitrospirota bacterium]|nr:hypothetical protein [Nitrospirota bacterium]
MTSPQNLQQIARQMIVSRMGAKPPPHELASAAVSIVETLVNTLSPLVGSIGSQALLGRSLTLTARAFPCYAEVRGAGQTLLNAVGACLQKQEPDVAMKATAALLTTYLELLATFIGERLTLQLLQAAWPDISIPPHQERHE